MDVESSQNMENDSNSDHSDLFPRPWENSLNVKIDSEVKHQHTHRE